METPSRRENLTRTGLHPLDYSEDLRGQAGGSEDIILVVLWYTTKLHMGWHIIDIIVAIIVRVAII